MAQSTTNTVLDEEDYQDSKLPRELFQMIQKIAKSLQDLPRVLDEELGKLRLLITKA